TIGLEYFRQAIACPFLEEESCSIYADRPITCREYLVTSPAEHCARPRADTVKQVPLPLKVWTALARMDEPGREARFIRWRPLILALEESESQHNEPPVRPGPEWLQELFEKLTQKKLSLPEMPALTLADESGSHA